MQMVEDVLAEYEALLSTPQGPAKLTVPLLCRSSIFIA